MSFENEYMNLYNLDEKTITRKMENQKKRWICRMMRKRMRQGEYKNLV